MVPSAWETALSTPAGIGLDASESGERAKVIFRHVRSSSEIFNKQSLWHMASDVKPMITFQDSGQASPPAHSYTKLHCLMAEALTCLNTLPKVALDSPAAGT